MTTTKAIRKGQLVWAHHPRGGIVIGKVGPAEPQPFAPPHRRLCGMTFSYFSAIDTVPRDQPIYAMDAEAAKALGVKWHPRFQDCTLEYVRENSQ